MERERTVPGAPGHNPGPRPQPQSSSSSTRNQSSSSGAGANWAFRPGFPFQGDFNLPNIPPGAGNNTFIVANSIDNSQISIVGSATNSSVNGGRPQPTGHQFTANSGGGVNYPFSQSQAASTPHAHDYHPAGQTADGMSVD